VIREHYPLQPVAVDLVERGTEAIQDRIVGGCLAQRAFPMYRRRNAAAQPRCECDAVACSQHQVSENALTCCDRDCSAPQAYEGYRRVLWGALAVNSAMFLVEIVAGIIAGSVSLRADALDFLADAANYAVALAVAGLTLRWRARAALLKGGVMGLFALWVAAGTVAHAITATVPRAELMSAIGLLALAANLAVAGLLYRYRAADSQAMSVWLCTRNDCIANIAVIVAGAGVWASGTPWPDIAVAAVICCLGLSSATHIIRRARAELRSEPGLLEAPAG
jgi:Co/Zn/Cd efflux system component